MKHKKTHEIDVVTSFKLIYEDLNNLKKRSFNTAFAIGLLSLSAIVLALVALCK
jgi:hypothetical protein